MAVRGGGGYLYQKYWLLIVIYLGSSFLKGKIVVFSKQTVRKTSQEFPSFVGSRSFYFPVFTSQHKSTSSSQVYKIFPLKSYNFPTVCFLPK